MKPKELYLGSCVQDLNAMAEKVDKSTNPKIYLKSMLKIVEGAQKAEQEGDQEKAYVLFMRYCSIFQLIIKSRDYSSHRTYYDSMLNRHQINEAMNRIEELQLKLSERFEEREAKRLLAKKDEERQKEAAARLEAMPTPPSPPSSPTPGLARPWISPTDFAELLRSSNPPLVFDLRPKTDAEAFPLKAEAVVCLDPSSVPPSATVRHIAAALNDDPAGLQRFERRSEASRVVLLDESSRPPLAGVLKRLMEALYEWDASQQLKEEPLTVDGGFANFFDFFPTLVANAQKCREVMKDRALKSRSTGEVEIRYPDLEERSRRKREEALEAERKLQEEKLAQAKKRREAAQELERKQREEAEALEKERREQAEAAEKQHEAAMEAERRRQDEAMERERKRRQAETAAEAERGAMASRLQTEKERNKEKQRQLNGEPVPPERSLKPASDGPEKSAKEAKKAASGSEKSAASTGSEQSAKEAKPAATGPDAKPTPSGPEKSAKEAKKAAKGAEKSTKEASVEAKEVDGANAEAKERPAILKEAKTAPQGPADEPKGSPSKAVTGKPAKKSILKSSHDQKEASHKEGKAKHAAVGPATDQKGPKGTSDVPRGDDRPAEAKAPVVNRALKPNYGNSLNNHDAKVAPPTKETSVGPSLLTNGSTRPPVHPAPRITKHPLKDEHWGSNSGSGSSSSGSSGARLKRSGSQPNLALSSREDTASGISSTSSRGAVGGELGATAAAHHRPLMPSRESKPRGLGESDLSQFDSETLRLMYAEYGATDRGLTGLRNLGNSCYMNSVLQALSNTPCLVQYIVSNRYRGHINRSNPAGHGGEIADEFATLLKALWTGSYRIISPIKFKRTVGRKNAIFATNEQQDSQEFLLFLLDGLHEDFNKGESRKGAPAAPAILEDEKAPLAERAREAWRWHERFNRSFVVSFFQGQFRSTVRCLTCDMTSTTFDVFMYLSLQIPSYSRCSLRDCISQFSKEEHMTGSSQWHCPRCRQNRDAVKHLAIWRLPPYLLIHLKRFSYEQSLRAKMNTLVDFPLQDLRMEQETGEPRTYDLYAVSNHYGSMESGHYTAHCLNPGLWKWFQFDDDVVKPLGEHSIRSSAAYILFYATQHGGMGQNEWFT